VASPEFTGGGDCHVEDVRIKVPRERGVVMWGLEGGTTPSPEII